MGAPSAEVGIQASVVEAAGIEPATVRIGALAKVGRLRSRVGQRESQVGQREGVAVCPECERRTAVGRNVSNPGRDASTTGAQRRERVGDPHDELAVVVEAWVGLPDIVRRAILGAVCLFE